jgi:hypothetical protein
MTQARLVLPVQDDLRYPTDEDFAETNPGKYSHTDRECEPMWNRIWKRWHDRALCLDWFKYRHWYSLEAWEHAFCQLAKKKNGEISRPATWVRSIARDYEANPEAYQKASEPKPEPPPMKAVQLTDEQRQWWADYYARQAAKKRKIG